MKKIFTILSIATVIAFAASSCSTMSGTTQIPKFTTSDQLYQLKTGNTYETVISTLGCNPYNLLSKQADGYEVYVYKYKIVERKIDSEVLNTRGGESAGEEVYNSKIENVFLIFKDNKLESVITDEGRSDSPKIVMLHNTIYELTKNSNGEYILVPTTLDTSKQESPFMSLGKK